MFTALKAYANIILAVLFVVALAGAGYGGYVYRDRTALEEVIEARAVEQKKYDELISRYIIESQEYETTISNLRLKVVPRIIKKAEDEIKSNDVYRTPVPDTGVHDFRQAIQALRRARDSGESTPEVPITP